MGLYRVLFLGTYLVNVVRLGLIASITTKFLNGSAFQTSLQMVATQMSKPQVAMTLMFELSSRSTLTLSVHLAPIIMIAKKDLEGSQWPGLILRTFG